MDEALIAKLLREKNARIRDLKEENYFLRDMLWKTSGGEIVEATIPTRKEEPVAPLLIDGLVRELLSE